MGEGKKRRGGRLAIVREEELGLVCKMKSKFFLKKTYKERKKERRKRLRDRERETEGGRKAG